MKPEEKFPFFAVHTLVQKTGKGLDRPRISAATTFQINGVEGLEIFFYLDFLRFHLFGNEFDEGHGVKNVSFF